MTATLRRLPPLGPAALILPALAAYAILLVWPLVSTLRASLLPDDAFSLAAYTRFFTDPLMLSVLRRTMVLSVITTAITLVLSYPIAVYLSQPWRRGRTLVTFAIIAPMLVSAVARSYGWIIILGPGGLFTTAITALGLDDHPQHLLFTEIGLVIASTHLFLPLMILPVAGSLQQIDPALIRAARILGAGPARAFLKVTLPMTIPGMSAGAVVVFCMCASSFVTPAMIGGSRIPMMSFVIYQQAILLFDWPFAAAASVVLLASTTVVTLAYSLWAGIGARRQARKPA